MCVCALVGVWWADAVLLSQYGHHTDYDANGDNVFSFESGQKERHYADGTRRIAFPNGAHLHPLK